MKDGRSHLAHKAEHAVDLDTGAVVAVTVQGADEGDPATSVETLIEAAERIETVVPEGEGLNEVIVDKGYHSNQELVDLEAVGVRSYISEPDRGRRNWKDHPEARDAVYRNRRRIRGARGKRLLRQRGERLERPFAHLYETGRMRRVYLRGHTNILITCTPAYRSVESRAPDAHPVWCGHAAQPPGARGCASLLRGVPHSASRDALGCDLDHVPAS
jgi:transposase